MEENQIYKDISRKLENLGWKKLDDFYTNQVEKIITPGEKVHDGYVYFFDETKEKTVKIEHDKILFDGELYKKIVRIFIFCLENGQIIIDDNIMYYVFHYDEIHNNIKKHWKLNKNNIDCWTTRRKIVDLKEVINYINHLNELGNELDKENVCLKINKITVNWDEDGEYYSSLWGENDEEKNNYYKALDFKRESIPEYK